MQSGLEFLEFREMSMVCLETNILPYILGHQTRDSQLYTLNLGNAKIRPTVYVHRMLNQGRQESIDAGPEVSLLFRKAVGTWLTSGLLHIPAMGSPFQLPCLYF